MSQGSFVDWLERDETVTAGADDFRRAADGLRLRLCLGIPGRNGETGRSSCRFLEVRCWMRPTGYTQMGRNARLRAHLVYAAPT
jgi:hypothetical protein